MSSQVPGDTEDLRDRSLGVAGFTTLEPMKRPAGEAWVVTASEWVVTASEKMRNRPILVRAHVPSQTARS